MNTTVPTRPAPAMVTPTAARSPQRGLAKLTIALLALAVGTAAALELPAGPMPGAGLSPGMHAMRGGDLGPVLPRVLAQAKDQLNLTQQQQALWDQAVAQAKVAREAGVANRQQVKDQLDAELAKDSPNLRAVATVADNVQAQNQAARHQVRELWFQVYDSFSAEQKAKVRELLKQKLARVEAFHETMKDQMQMRRRAAGS